MSTLKRYIITGTPGSGKTATLRRLEAMGYAVVAEAATDVIECAQAQGHDQPWQDPGFVDQIVAVQRRRQEMSAVSGCGVQIYDRSPICTLALARYLGQPVSDLLAAEVTRVVRERIYDRRAFFVRPIGFVETGAARRITFEESLEFERLHEQAYRAHGYELVSIARGEIANRAAEIDRYIQSWINDTML